MVLSVGWSVSQSICWSIEQLVDQMVGHLIGWFVSPVSFIQLFQTLSLIPKKVKGDRDRRPFWAGGENQVARRLFENLGGSWWFSSTE